MSGPHPLVDALRRIRRASHLTQDDVALLVFADRKTVNRWETGRTAPDIKALSVYADLLGYELVLRRKPCEVELGQVTPTQAALNRAVLARSVRAADDYEPAGGAA